MTNDPGLIQKGTRNSMLPEFAISRSFTPLPGPRTLRNWRSMRIGPSFINIGKVILYPLEGARSPGSQKSSRLPTFTIAPVGGSCGVTCASQAVTAERDDLAEMDIDSESVLQCDCGVS